MILIGLGSNLSGTDHDSPRAVLDAALAEMAACGIKICRLSRFYNSAPVPKSDQPWYVNAVAAIETELAPSGLLKKLHEIEAGLGRKRRIRWESRIVDLDLLAYDDRIISSDEITIPHPRLDERAFVLLPIMDIDAQWRHPVSHKTSAELAKQADQADISVIRDQ